MRTSDLIEEYLGQYKDHVPVSQIKKDLKLTNNSVTKGIRQLSYRNMLNVNYVKTKKFVKLESEIKQ